jgi:hypothetical protein
MQSLRGICRGGLDIWGSCLLGCALLMIADIAAINRLSLVCGMGDCVSKLCQVPSPLRYYLSPSLNVE